MSNPSSPGLEELLRPIASLIGKSEKAQRNLAPGTWQHAMLQDNLHALHIAFALMNPEADDTACFTEEDLHKALRALDSMIRRSENAQAKFSPGTSQHTLQQNRIRALRAASEWIRETVRKEEAAAVSVDEKDGKLP